MIDPSKYGVSFSAKQCQNLGLDPHETLDWLLKQGWRRFRLMSYWSDHEKHPGTYDFAKLDWQLEAIAKQGGVVTLCLGAKQPRWPEYHWPKWAWESTEQIRTLALLQYNEMVIRRYKAHPEIISYQLENEALLHGFGSRVEIDRTRLRKEYELIKRLDSTRPVIMSTSNGWGIPIRPPRPDLVGFSYYTRVHSHGRYHSTIQKPLLHRTRRFIIEKLLRRPVFVHELQCEPWGPKAIWEMEPAEQDKSMGVAQIRQNIAEARRIGAYPIDLWGGEWWYWRKTKKDDPSIWHAVQDNLI